ncbi:MAG: hypothetical protein WCJ29_00025 [bacterium]
MNWLASRLPKAEPEIQAAVMKAALAPFDETDGEPLRVEPSESTLKILDRMYPKGTPAKETCDRLLNDYRAEMRSNPDRGKSASWHFMEMNMKWNDKVSIVTQMIYLLAVAAEKQELRNIH